MVLAREKMLKNIYFSHIVESILYTLYMRLCVYICREWTALIIIKRLYLFLLFLIFLFYLETVDRTAGGDVIRLVCAVDPGPL